MLHPLAAAGRGGDTELAHVTPGEMVIPKAVLAQPGVQAMLSGAFAEAGRDPARFVVGARGNSRNPRTGMREYWGGEGPGNDGTGGGSTGGGSTGGDPSSGGEDPTDDGDDIGVSDQDVADAIADANADPGGDSGNGVVSAVTDAVEAVISALTTGSIFADNDKDGKIDSGRFAGHSVSHDPADTDPDHPDYGGKGSREGGWDGGDLPTIKDPAGNVVNPITGQVTYTPEDLPERKAPERPGGGEGGGGKSAVERPEISGGNVKRPGEINRNAVERPGEIKGVKRADWSKLIPDELAPITWDGGVLDDAIDQIAGTNLKARQAVEAGIATAQVNRAHDRAKDQLRRDLQRRGVQPGSGQYAAAMRELELSRASGVAGAATTSRLGARDKLFEQRLAVGQAEEARQQGRVAAETERGKANIARGLGLIDAENRRYATDVTQNLGLIDAENRRYATDANLELGYLDAENRRYATDVTHDLGLINARNARYATDVTYDLGQRKLENELYGIDTGRYVSEREIDLKKYLGDKELALGYRKADISREVGLAQARGGKKSGSRFSFGIGPVQIRL